jgi:uncharacterized protein (TIGR03435 family)
LGKREPQYEAQVAVLVVDSISKTPPGTELAGDRRFEKHMKKTINTILLGCFLLTSLAAQTPTPRLEFDAVSVKPVEGLIEGKAASGGMRVDGAQFHLERTSALGLITGAYNLRRYQVIGPDWLSGLRFNVDAKLPAGAKRSQIPEMMQFVLAERFGMKFHNESRELPVYALVTVGVGTKLKDLTDPNEVAVGESPAESKGYGGPGGMGAAYSDGASYALGDGKFEAKKLSMVRLASILSCCIDLPAVDMTGLKGKYDMSFPLPDDVVRGMITRAFLAGGGAASPEAQERVDALDDSPLFDGLRSLGLKLERRKLAMPVMVIDSISKTPTEN